MIHSLQQWKENKELAAAARIYARQASETLDRVLTACENIDPEKAYRIIQAVAQNLRLAEMAIDGGGQT